MLSVRIPIFLLLILSGFPACKKPVNPCVQMLELRDREILKQADSLVDRRETLQPEAYRAALQELHDREKQLFGEVENCDFGKNLQAYNYWYRGRLKFPGKVGQELRRLDSLK